MAGKKEPQAESLKERVALHLRAADIMAKDGKLAEAILQIETALTLDPRSYYARSFLERTRAQMSKMQQKMAETAVQEKAKPAPEDQKIEQISLLLRAADQFIAMKHFKLASQQVAKVFAIDPQNQYAKMYAEQINKLVDVDKRVFIPTPGQPAPPAAPAAPAPVAEPEAAAAEGERASVALYRELLKEMWFDGQVTDPQRQELAKVREIFKITGEEHAELEKQIQIDAYIEALRIAWRDGVITQNENDVLQLMREKFNISMEEHMSAEAKILWAKQTPDAMASILLADDEQTLLLTLAAYLRKHGYDVLTADSVEKAFEILQRTIPSIIVSDLFFGEGHFTGIEFYQRVREDERLKNVPFLLMSGISDEFVVRAGVRMGVDNFLQKPFDLELLLATIEGRLKA